MKKHIVLSIALVLITFVAINAHAETLFYDDFTENLTWTTSDNSVYIKDNAYLYIDADSTDNDDWAEKSFSIDVLSGYPIVIEQRIKLDKGGL